MKDHFLMAPRGDLNVASSWRLETAAGKEPEAQGLVQEAR